MIQIIGRLSPPMRSLKMDFYRKVLVQVGMWQRFPEYASFPRAESGRFRSECGPPRPANRFPADTTVDLTCGRSAAPPEWLVCWHQSPRKDRDQTDRGLETGRTSANFR